MSLNGIMGIGISSVGAQNPWDANSPAAVDFRRPERIEVRGAVNTEGKASAPADYVTLHSGGVQVGSVADATAQVDQVGSTFRTVV